MPRYGLSIKLKLLLPIIPILAVMVFLTTALFSTYVRNSFEHEMEKQQIILLSLMAQNLDDQFSAHQKSLIAFSKQLPNSDLADPRALERFIDSHPALLGIFDNNVLIFTPEGVVLAEAAQRPSRTGTDFSYRDYIIQTRKKLQPIISKPFASRLPNHPPAVMFTAPVLDKNGALLAIVGGSINLLRPNLLGKLATAKIGNSGYFYLSDLDRTMIMHPDRNRLLKLAAAPGVNKLYDKAMAGFEGAGKTVDSAGVPMLSAFKRLESVDWVLAAQIPTAEVYASVDTAQSLVWVITAFALPILITLAILLASRLLAPLQSLTAQVAQLKYDTNYQPVKVTTNDEFGELATAFNSLMSQLQARERDLSSSRELYQFVADFSNAWIFWRVPSGSMLYVSPAAERITGYSVDELMAEPSLSSTMIHPDDRGAWEQHLCQVDQGQGNASLEFRIVTKGGQIRWLRHACDSIFDSNSVLLGVRGANEDITERREALISLQENEEKFRLIASSAHEAIIMADTHQRVSFWNQAAERLFGVDAASALGIPLATFLPDLVDAVHQAGNILDSGLTLELPGRHEDGHLMTLELSISRARLSGDGVSVILGRDITERKQAEEKLLFISFHDALTRLFNRVAFEHHLIRIDQEGPFPVAVIMADLDGLKLVNDTQGHEAGDRLIKATADLLASSFRNNDIVARIGGDEFIMLLPGITADVAQNKYDLMLRRIELFSEIPGNPNVSLSCGMTQVTGPGQMMEAVRQADQAMYQDKSSRRKNIFSV